MCYSRTIPKDVRRAAIAKSGTAYTEAGASHKHGSPPGKLLKRVLHLNGKCENIFTDEKQTKRLRTGNDADVIVIDSDSEEAGPSEKAHDAVEEVDHSKILSLFRVSVSKLA